MSIMPRPKFNFHRLLKKEMVWLGTHNCKAHGHTYLEHPQCYFREAPQDGPVVERIGFLDIEASGLDANWAYVFSYCIKELDGELIHRVVTNREVNSYNFDYNLMKDLVQDIRKFDRIIVYYGKDYRYDVPFLRTRALFYNLDFPKYKELIVNDLYDVVKKKLKLHRNRLQTACEFLDIPCKAHRLETKIWQRAQAGDKKSLSWILEHNKEDVISLEALWKKLADYVRSSDTSI